MTMKPTAPESDTHEHIQQFIHRFKSSHATTKPLSEENKALIATSEETSYKETDSLKKIVKTLAERLKEAQETILMLQQEKSTFIEHHNSPFDTLSQNNNELQKEIADLKGRLYEAEKKWKEEDLRRSEVHETAIFEQKALLQKKLSEWAQEKEKLEQALTRLKQEAKSTPSKTESNSSIESLHNEILRLRAALKEKESSHAVRPVSPALESQTISKPQQMAAPREVVAKMALSIKSLEDELHGSRCEKIALQREIKHLTERLYKEESNLKLISSEKTSLEEKSHILETTLQKTENEKLTEHTLRVDYERSLSCKEAELFETQQAKALLEEEVLVLRKELSRATEAEKNLESQLLEAIQQIQNLERTLSEKELVLQSTSERYHEIESLLAEKLEKEVLFLEEISTLREEKDRFAIEKTELAQQVEGLVTQISILEREKQESEERENILRSDFDEIQQTCHKLEKIRYSLEGLLESSLQASDLMRKANEIMSKAQGNYFSNSEREKMPLVGNDENEYSETTSSSKLEEHSIPSFRISSSSYNLF